MKFSVLKTIRRNIISVLFPTVAVWAIYADWSHTREVKLERAKKLELSD